MKLSTIRLLPLLFAGIFGVGCHEPKPAAETPNPSEEQNRPEGATQVSESTQRQWTYLNRIRQGDAFNTAIDRTLRNDQNELGVVLSSGVPPDQVPALMGKVMMEMAKAYPREDVTLAVYTASAPRHKIGTAHLDGQTSKTTYTPSK
jgi:hypothetical protein